MLRRAFKTSKVKVIGEKEAGKDIEEADAKSVCQLGN